jgi:hypothetical protein
MQDYAYEFFDDKVILRIRNRVCNTEEELLRSGLFDAVFKRYLKELEDQHSSLLDIFPQRKVDAEQIQLLKETLIYLINLPGDKASKLVSGSETYFRDPFLFNEFVEQLYNYWRSQHRLVICEAVFSRLDQRPYRAFNDMVESLMHLVRSAYRDIQENITGNHPKIYRQVSAGAEVGAIALPKNLMLPEGWKQKLGDIYIIRQALLYPPLIFSTPANKRTGVFERIDFDPISSIAITPKEWLCYPAKVGPLLILIYFTLHQFELGFSLCNLFEIAEDHELERVPDAMLLYGINSNSTSLINPVFFEDQANQLLIGTIPQAAEFSYFGYLKKLTLTLHNIKRMQAGCLPIHGAIVRIKLRGCTSRIVILVGDTGAGKSETLEALRRIASQDVDELIIIADDMGSLEFSPEGQILAYGTEVGAFVRLDDLQKDYALGQIDRTIIMNPEQVNARVVVPVTRFEYIMYGWPVDCILYANNYEEIDNAHPILEVYSSKEDALEVFRRGAVMSKGTTTTTGLVENYFANIFGPPQYKDLHEDLANKFFSTFFKQKVLVGQLRTMLGIPGNEQSGPMRAAESLLTLIRNLNISK